MQSPSPTWQRQPAHLIVGATAENVGGIRTGAVFELFGTASGFGGSGNKELTQNTSGIPDNAESGDAFGSELVAGQFGHAGPSDVAIGVSGEDLTVNGETFTNTGLVHLLFGSS